MKILLAIQSEAILRPCAAMLESMHFETSLARSGDEAISKFISERPELVVLEYELPKENGVDLTFEMLYMKPSTRIVMFSTSNRTSLQKVEKIGVEILLVAPFPVKRLVDSILTISKLHSPVAIVAR